MAELKELNRDLIMSRVRPIVAVEGGLVKLILGVELTMTPTQAEALAWFMADGEAPGGVSLPDLLKNWLMSGVDGGEPLLETAVGLEEMSKVARERLSQ
jgi:hypothetical protein